MVAVLGREGTQSDSSSACGEFGDLGAHVGERVEAEEGGEEVGEKRWWSGREIVSLSCCVSVFR